MLPKNPIEKELQKLDAQWEEFVESELPILRWKVSPDANQLVYAYIKLREQFEDSPDDFFISLHSDFSSLEQFGYDLSIELDREITTGIEASMEDEEKNETEDESNQMLQWEKPDLNTALSGHDALFKCCNAVLTAFNDYFTNLVIVIWPHQISSLAQYQKWLEQACKIHRDYPVWGNNLKWIILDNEQQPGFNRLAQDYPEQILSQTPPLNLQGAINQVLEEADDGSDGAGFRQFLVDMNYAVQNNDLNELEKKSEAALGIAEKNQWSDMQVTVLLLRASGYLNAKRLDNALQDYQDAQAVAATGVKSNKPGCDKLLFQAHISEGSALLADKRYDEAAEAFRQSADIAEEQGDAMMSMESRRLQSYCFEQLKNKNRAWASALLGLNVARTIPADQRQYSTLPYLGEALVRVAPDREEKSHVHQAMTDLLGDAWQKPARKPVSA
ncbi:hypothetical protein BTA51_13455 [Hahella sp. CCB-MM4]|uniref:tetratricopeptide repeat protein n=1 Tax=Hahella sp. (strain CCB-MM4) TaxID=1926491 RepID=UPI000B9BCA92|nr:tetratricopeptide repeat protein [Hahella sp. CCB-MM4]OZG72960.1 hypothetical protein BTA51_13455 [Hahella sp. CCB-MM4]